MSATTSPDQSRQSVSALMAAHDRDRLAWAFRAYDRFVASLSPEIRERLAHKGHQAEAYVVVFGKTQVGKTTLLMDLMGVSHDAMERVSTVLRGGRSHGNSATATTMEYRRSEDHRWGLCVQKETHRYADDNAITAAIGDLREKMENRELVVDSPCVVSIPSNCFSLPADQKPAVRMLDLPGDQPANSTEQEHVHKMARKYVPSADLILLVGRGDDLSFLQPGGLTLPGIEDWQSVPGRFRIITTYSFTAQSVRALVRQHQGSADAEIYRKRLIEQIEKFAPLSTDAKNPRRYFPLEFGKSWLAARESQPDLYARVSPMINELKRQLHNDIHESTTPMARLQGAVEARVVIARVKENQLKFLETAAESVQYRLKQAQDDQKLAQTTAEQIDQEYQEMVNRLSLLSERRLSVDLASCLQLPGSTHTGDPDESVSGFRFLISNARSSLTQRLADCRPNTARLSDTAWLWRGVKADLVSRLDRITKILDLAFDGFSHHLSDYLIDKYWFTGSDSDYQADRRRLKACIEKAESSLLEAARQWWHEAAKQHLNALQIEGNALRLKHKSWLQRADGMMQPIAELKQKLIKQEEERATFERQMAADLAESQRFIELLDREYLTELRHRRQNILEERQTCQAFIGLLATVQLSQTRQQLLLRIEPTGA